MLQFRHSSAAAVNSAIKFVTRKMLIAYFLEFCYQDIETDYILFSDKIEEGDIEEDSSDDDENDNKRCKTDL